MRAFITGVSLLALTCALSMGAASPTPAETGLDTPAAIPADDYALYDLIVDEKFLTPETKLVVLERATLTRLHPEQQGPLRLETFHQYEIFDDRLPGELVRDFLLKNQTPSKLDKRFGFGTRYRFVSGEGAEQQETSMPSILVSKSSPRLIQEEPLEEPPAVIDRLAFSRVAYTFGREQALIYVEYNRPTGAGAGFAVWLNRSGAQWRIFDSELVWAGRLQ
ncbi:MAG: hypothetical protein K0S79_1088 [Nitrospira sp.]|nr:hypothetical protein [Nitrospira sp.]